MQHGLVQGGVHRHVHAGGGSEGRQGLGLGLLLGFGFSLGLLGLLGLGSLHLGYLGRIGFDHPTHIVGQIAPADDHEQTQDNCHDKIFAVLHAGRYSMKQRLRVTPRRGHGIISRAAPGVAAGQSTQGQPAAAQYAVGHDGFQGVGGTCGVKTTGRGQDRRDEQLVEADGQDEETAQHG